MFYRCCSRKLVKGFDGCWASANRPFGFGGQGSDGGTCIIFCMSDSDLLATNWNIFPLLGRIKQNIYFVIGKKSEFWRYYLVSFQPLSCLSIIPILTMLLCRKGQWYCIFRNDDFSFNKLFSFLKIIRNFSTLKQAV